ncbi:GEN1 Holliday junction 5' flap endonuclease [Homo sapiens]|uniref:flap endonuclease GEN homolog 1 isoform X1 n=1 Tax=Homo sapiens TaxID=9606 RepID=UPI00079FCFE8|nr:flap endonuclease GEN homolog 1 isoform X1 [Homo sapiens]XP_054197746.1 flap endonuclease GEN homolog 1 isoform X1 [Homo sapiens]XP_054197747.1 flap endonuclease GEN homolog 1 isoform X1 [Homo sapiens]XP_054197748.1 flap endonuclease GEN homolog 1 isoform X1 [Homo sapiens]XP_054197749.1 flap endonuclease GEN homolog 1 isoform X1 [Homo sapiens]XP_054197750.1 flap endonuclease GEN homolog 1 isoform X1 [Homo sapiens]KAI4033649.1 GEN1 Holliday junction 5' flap endonuclease [Homo sapiens]KAI40|eukprot:NP_001123481.2 flap endonuclease GEN homolog 1 [Homo sapiens]
MGVNDLWQILEPVKQHIPLRNLGGKTIAVDLSLWVCEAQTVKKMMGSVMKPHLRNLFFRISYLTQMDVKLVFVMEGEPPKLKADVISKRNQSRYGSSGKSWSQKTGRSHFKSVLRECLHMLECLGIPWVQAAGEAEAMCAYLNAGGHVDGCLTNDGDTFLYGAQTVYRNFTMNTKDPHVDCYTMSSIKSKLGLDRDALVGLAILLGCDYLPKGVPGVGKEQALKLIQILKGQSLLQRFNRWNETSCNSSPQLLVTKKLAHCSVCSHPGSPKDHERNGCRLCKSDKYCEPHDYEYCCPCEWHRTEHDRQLNEVENNIKKKACCCEGFPFHEVIQEFLLNKDKLVKVIRYQRPDLLLFQRFTLEKMEWPNHYACEKLLVLLTHYDMIERKLGSRNSNQLQPIRIVKTRIRNGVHCFEIEWEKPEHYAMEDKQHGEFALLTIEEESLFEAAYPEIVAVYQKQKLEIKGKKQKRIKPKENNLPEPDEVMSFQSHMTLKPTCEIFHKQNSKLNSGISPDPTLPQESISASLNSLLLPKNTPCLNAQEQFMSSLRPLAIQQIKAVSKSLISESSQPNTSSHNISVIADLHLSTIDWEGTSFSNSPAIQRNTFSHDLKSEVESELSAIPDGFENIPEQLSCESERYTANIKKVLDEDSDGISPEEHLLSGITDLCLQDLPLKERIFTKLSYPQDNLQPDVNLKTLSILSVKESCIANSGSDCTSHLSKDLPGIPLQNESRDSKILKGDQLLQEDYKVNTSVPYSVSNTVVKTCNVRPPNTALDHSRKVDMQTTRKILMKKSVCLDRHSSDEQSAPVFGKAKYTTQRMKHSSQKHNSSHFKESGHNKLSSPKIHIKETEQCVRSYETAENEESCFPDSTKSSLSSLQCHKKENNSGTCLDSPLPLRQRLKLRFQST